MLVSFLSSLERGVVRVTRVVLSREQVVVTRVVSNSRGPYILVFIVIVREKIIKVETRLDTAP